jgi:hypothetical protein
MGQVYRALDTRLNRSVAVKFAREPFGDRFGREARAIAQLNHPHICTLYDVGPNYLVMELVDGETLDARLKNGALPIDRVLRYGAQIADALAAAHAKGIIHRDLKPGNIMLTKAGVKVLDFGLAKTDETVTQNPVVMGTPAYMAPEQIEGKDADARTDIYALGLVLREMATGKRSGEMEGLPPQFVHVVQRCIDADPAERWQAASDVKKELEWSGLNPPAVRTGVRSSSRLAWVAAALAFAGILALAVTWGPARICFHTRADTVHAFVGKRNSEVDFVPDRFSDWGILRVYGCRLQWRNSNLDPAAQLGGSPPRTWNRWRKRRVLVAGWKLDRILRGWEVEEGQSARRPTDDRCVTRSTRGGMGA